LSWVKHRKPRASFSKRLGNLFPANMDRTGTIIKAGKRPAGQTNNFMYSVSHSPPGVGD